MLWCGLASREWLAGWRFRRRVEHTPRPLRLRCGGTESNSCCCGAEPVLAVDQTRHFVCDHVLLCHS